MKTPREILLKRHRSVEPKLDRMWDKSLAASVAAVYDRRDSKRNLFLAVGWTLWRELILPSRRIWTGLACAWILILTLNLATRDESPVIAKRSSLSQEAISELRQQEVFFAELIGVPESRNARPPAPLTPGSQSERRREFLEA